MVWTIILIVVVGKWPRRRPRRRRMMVRVLVTSSACAAAAWLLVLLRTSQGPRASSQKTAAAVVPAPAARQWTFAWVPVPQGWVGSSRRPVVRVPWRKGSSSSKAGPPGYSRGPSASAAAASAFSPRARLPRSRGRSSRHYHLPTQVWSWAYDDYCSSGSICCWPLLARPGPS